ncbi:MAG: hypothetical protein U5R30_18755 [Deltaproteobacteria bacterium]|nr:hypothetical protein [Deltaproteobacteria bacterium]
MKQKYEIIKDDEKKTLILREYAELDKDILSPLCEESYDIDALAAAVSGGRSALVAALRTKNMYPPGFYAERIADAVAELLEGRERQVAELLFDDIELLNREREIERQQAEVAEKAKINDEVVQIDELLADDFEDDEDDFEGGGEIKDINSLKVADDEYVEGEEEP